MTFATGLVCSGAPMHEVASWTVGPDRMLRLAFAGAEIVVPVPIPGDLAIATVEPFRRVVTFRPDGSRLWLDSRRVAPVWRPISPLMEGKMLEHSGNIVWGGMVGCGMFGYLTEERLILLTKADSIGPSQVLTDAPLPGDSPVASVSVGPPAAAVFADGSRWVLSGGTWVRVPGLVIAPNASGPGRLRLRALRGLAIGGEVGDVGVGQVFEIPESEALAYVRSGRCEVLAEPAA